MNRKRRVVNISLLMVLALPGCGLDFWERHATPQSQYGRERAELLCHPFNDCTQGTWVADENISGDPNEAYVQCTEEKLRYENGWSKDTVSMGLEINRCMEGKGYRLARK